jgi:hypothetical protein
MRLTRWKKRTRGSRVGGGSEICAAARVPTTEMMQGRLSVLMTRKIPMFEW